MDSITQIVLGAAAGEVVLGKKVGNKAMLWGAIAGTIPDLDVVAKAFLDDVSMKEFHRSFSHSILFSIIFAPILGRLAYLIHKKLNVSWQDWSWLMFWSLFTHPLLDAHTAFGTQLFWPLPYKITYNNIFIIDPLYTLPFLFFLILAMRRKKEDPKRSYYNRLGIIISCSYMALTLGFKGIAHHQFKSALDQQNIAYERLEAKPTPLNAILWCGYVETNASYLLGYYSLLAPNKPISFFVFPKKQHLLGGWKDADLVKRLVHLSRGWFNIETEAGKMYYYDLRFGQIGFNDDPNSFVFKYELYSEEGKLKAKQVQRNFNGIGKALTLLFHRILTN
jgi:inner membrane protein